METPLHILSIDLSKLTDFEIVDLSMKFHATKEISRSCKNLSEELSQAQSQISAFNELIHK